MSKSTLFHQQGNGDDKQSEKDDQHDKKNGSQSKGYKQQRNQDDQHDNERNQQSKTVDTQRNRKEQERKQDDQGSKQGNEQAIEVDKQSTHDGKQIVDKQGTNDETGKEFHNQNRQDDGQHRVDEKENTQDGESDQRKDYHQQGKGDNKQANEAAEKLDQEEKSTPSDCGGKLFSKLFTQTPKTKVQILDSTETMASEKFAFALQKKLNTYDCSIIKNTDGLQNGVPLIVICIHSTRLKADIDLATENLDDTQKYMVLIVHTTERKLPILPPSKRLSECKENVKYTDMGFDVDKGDIYKCQGNTTAINDLNIHINDIIKAAKETGTPV